MHYWFLIKTIIIIIIKMAAISAFISGRRREICLIWSKLAHECKPRLEKICLI